MSRAPGPALVILAHPLEESLCAHFAQVAAEALAKGGAPVTVLDLYRRDFDPRLTPGERRSYYVGNYRSELPSDMADSLQAAEVLVLVFPTWWFGLPAILKGFIDRAFAPGLAFDHAPDLSAIRPKLKNLRHVAIVTTLGSPWWVDRLVLFRPLFRIMRFGVMKPCAPQARVRYHPFYAAESADPGRIERFTQKLTVELKRLGT